MTMKTRPFHITLLSTLAACLLATPLLFAQSKPADASASASDQAIKKAVLETNAKMTQAANNVDVETFFSYMADPCVIIQNGTAFKTRAEAKEAVKRGFAGISKIDRRFDDPQVTVISPDVALLSAEGSVSATLTDGRTMDGGRFAVSVVFVRRDGQWKVMHGHYSMPARM
jgi:uncharacterized protein (TIGR02246 family)